MLPSRLLQTNPDLGPLSITPVALSTVEAIRAWVGKNFQTQSTAEKSLLRTKSRDKVGTVSVGDQQLLTGQGELTVFVGQ